MLEGLVFSNSNTIHLLFSSFANPFHQSFSIFFARSASSRASHSARAWAASSPVTVTENAGFSQEPASGGLPPHGFFIPCFFKAVNRAHMNLERLEARRASSEKLDF